MPTDPHAKQIADMIASRLAPGEELEAWFGATTARPDNDGRGFVMEAALVPLLWAVDYLTWLYTTRKASRASGVPLARRMIIAVTSRRLLIHKSSRRWTLGDLAGEIPREQVTAVTIYGPVARTRGCVLHLSTGKNVTLQVSRNVTDILTALFPAPGH